MSRKQSTLICLLAIGLPVFSMANPSVFYEQASVASLKQHPCSKQVLPIEDEVALIKAIKCDYPEHTVLDIAQIELRPEFVQVKIIDEQKGRVSYIDVHYASGLTELEEE